MRTVTVRHYWQDYEDEDAYEGDIHVETESDEVTFADVRDLIRWLRDEIFWVGDWSNRAETCDGGEAVYYNCQWPEGFHTGDPQHRSGSFHFDGDTSPHALHAVMRHFDVYDVNARWRTA